MWPDPAHQRHLIAHASGATGPMSAIPSPTVVVPIPVGNIQQSAEAHSQTEADTSSMSAPASSLRFNESGLAVR